MATNAMVRPHEMTVSTTPDPNRLHHPDRGRSRAGSLTLPVV